jgi:cell division transport system permease protein
LIKKAFFCEQLLSRAAMISFWIGESFKAIKRAKSSFVLSLISMTIAVFLITVSFFSFYLADEFQKNLKKNVYLNIFINDNVQAQEIDSLEQVLKEKVYTDSLEFIDKEEAARIFTLETGEDFRKILEYNPLPASFILVLKDSHIQKDSIEKVAEELSAIKSVDEVTYKTGFIKKILTFLNDFNKYLIAGTAVIFFIAVYIVYSTVKLIISNKYEELETMKLVGAKLSTIKIPIILNAVWIGFFAGLISSAVFLLLINYAPGINLTEILAPGIVIYLFLLLLIGPLLGLLISWISLRRITLMNSPG